VVREGILWGARLAAAAALLGIGAGAGAAPSDGASNGPGESIPPPGAVDTPMIGGPSTCPQPEAVWAELGTLLPRDRLNDRLRAVAGTSGPVVQLIDLGVPYRVIAAGRVREYRDETRDCAYRARIAAVFIALAIDPAEISMEQPTPPPSPPAPAPPVDQRPRAGAHLDLGVGGELGEASGNVATHAGAALRLAVGRGRFALMVGAMALAPVDVTLGGVRLRQWHLPVDVGVRAQLDGKWLEPYGELGLGAAWLSERSLDLASPRGGTSVELGVRAGLGARLATRGRFAPFVALDADLVPSPPAVFALPQGVLGHTPLLWLGATVGASLEFL
jgi:hypothetical protein